MPLFRAIGAWAMERGVDGIGLVVLVSLVPVLPLILGSGLLYELISRLDSRRALSSSVHWALAVAITVVLIVAIAVLLLLPPS
jgi:hypothetical protein